MAQVPIKLWPKDISLGYALCMDNYKGFKPAMNEFEDLRDSTIMSVCYVARKLYETAYPDGLKGEDNTTLRIKQIFYDIRIAQVALQSNWYLCIDTNHKLIKSGVFNSTTGKPAHEIEDFSLTQTLHDQSISQVSVPWSKNIKWPKIMNEKQQNDWYKIVDCEHMCSRLLILDHGEKGLPDIDNKYVNRLKKLYRSIKNLTTTIRKLYYEYVDLSCRLDKESMISPVNNE